MARSTRNDSDRSQWVDNDEGLYRDWKRSRLSKREYIRRNRAELDRVIDAVTSGSKPAHYLVYGD